MSGPKRLIRTALLLSAVFIARGEAAQLHVDGALIDFDPGPGMCALDSSASDFDRLMLEWQRNANASSSELLGFFVECARLTGLRRGDGANLGQYGIMLAPLNGRPRVTPIRGYTRSGFLDDAGKAMEKALGSVDVAETSSRMFSALNSEARAAIGRLEMGGLRSLGVLDRDASAVYSGFAMKVQTDASSTVVAGVSAVTLVKGYPLQYTLYRSYLDDSSFRSLLDALKPAMHGLVQNNDPVGGLVSSAADQNPILAGIDWRSVGESGVRGAVIGGLIAGVVALWRRRRSRSGNSGDS